MELAQEDSLRLHVLLANSIYSLRINENTLMVEALLSHGEVQIKLHPTGQIDRYLRMVRELIAGHILGSPGGFPRFIARWNRMGQAREDNLTKLLLLGEPEAVVAVANAEALTPELARLAWWAMPDAENARSMLARPAIAQSELGVILAEYLFEHLPFETEAKQQIYSVQLILQANTTNKNLQQRLWQQTEHHYAYLAGFLAAIPDQLPVSYPEHKQYAYYKTQLTPLLETEKKSVFLLLKVLSPMGQSFFNTAQLALMHAADQDVILHLFETISHYLADFMATDLYTDTMDFEQLQKQALIGLNQPEIKAILELEPNLRPVLIALLILSGLRYSVIRPILSKTSAVGQLMRRKLQPVMTPIFDNFSIVLNKTK
jgi:hypothetical protein